MKEKNDRLDLKFTDKQFLETLEKWKRFCKFLTGGQTERIVKLIKDDLPKLKEEIARKEGFVFK